MQGGTIVTTIYVKIIRREKNGKKEIFRTTKPKTMCRKARRW